MSQIFSAISLRIDGSMKLPGNQLESDEITQNRNAFLEKHSVNPQSVVGAELEHGNNIKIVSAADKGQIVPHVDGLITSEKGVYLSITVADCLPITLYDSKKSILCLLHAGWRGLENRIIDKALTTLTETYGVNAAELLVGIG
ncbi:MAG: polyphenol oxidase family protein, partial [Microgenomates group bacterium]